MISKTSFADEILEISYKREKVATWLEFYEKYALYCVYCLLRAMIRLSYQNFASIMRACISNRLFTLLRFANKNPWGKEGVLFKGRQILMVFITEGKIKGVSKNKNNKDKN